jgi:O-acetyl-ADP-ribose deacetylase (regulator of RNase III)
MKMTSNIWEAELDGEYKCTVTRINKRGGNLRVVENTTGRELLNQDVGLLYGAQFGPDVEDVAKWQDICVAVVERDKMKPHYTNTSNPVDFPQTVNEIDAVIKEHSGESMLKHTKGNLLDLAEAGEFDIVVQGCNCFNTMGGGIAREIRERYPVAALVDNETQKGDYNKLGNYTTAFTGKFLIVNAYTQYNMSQGTDVFEYTAFDLLCQKLHKAYGTKKIGLPYIGMGLAGGNKDVIMEQIEYFATRVTKTGGTVTLVEFGG